MTNHAAVRVAVLLAAALMVLAPVAPGVAGPPAEPGAMTVRSRLPIFYRPVPEVCPQTSGRSYVTGPVFQRDGDNPVRKAWEHADKNIELRGYAQNNGVSLAFVGGSTESPQPPQLATLFNPNRVPAFTRGFRIYNWNWAPSPNPGTRGSISTSWPVNLYGMQTTPGEALRVPTSGYDIGQGMEVIVLYADDDSVTLNYSRDDTVTNGYTVHVDNICTDPNLLNLYNQHDQPGGPRYQIYGKDGIVDYHLVTLSAGQVFGTARDGEIRAGVVDSGSFMDPRYCNDWWQIRPSTGC
jgi:hypothetical protein